MIKTKPAKLITQIAIVGTQILARAFVDAYKAAAQNAAKNSSSAMAASASGDLLTRKTGMTVDEAAQILDIQLLKSGDRVAKDGIDLRKASLRYDHLFIANDPLKGGSFYLQSKVFRAKERLELEIQKLEQDWKDLKN